MSFSFYIAIRIIFVFSLNSFVLGVSEVDIINIQNLYSNLIIIIKCIYKQRYTFYLAY